MKNKLFAVSACAAGIATAAHAETWRMGLEFIQDWSLFICSPTVGDRFWDFALEGSRLKADGPEGVTWTTTVAADGSFKANFTGIFRDLTIPVEMSGNVNTRRILIHDTKYDCWYRLVPTPPF